MATATTGFFLVEILWSGTKKDAHARVVLIDGLGPMLEIVTLEEARELAAKKPADKDLQTLVYNEGTLA